jgi:hypothetical protein
MLSGKCPVLLERLELLLIPKRPIDISDVPWEDTEDIDFFGCKDGNWGVDGLLDFGGRRKKDTDFDLEREVLIDALDRIDEPSRSGFGTSWDFPSGNTVDADKAP